MLLAENKYASRVKRQLWGGKSEEQKQIIALTSTVSTFKNSLKIKKNTFDKDQNKNKTKNKKKNKTDKDNKWAWKEVAPKNGEKTKKYSGKTYYWCPNHNAWTLHTPEQCNKKNGGPTAKRSASSADQPNEGGNAVSFAASVESIMDELEEEE